MSIIAPIIGMVALAVLLVTPTYGPKTCACRKGAIDPLCPRHSSLATFVRCWRCSGELDSDLYCFECGATGTRRPRESADA